MKCLAGYYDIQFYLPVCGYKSDDILRIWVDAEGKVTSFSEFNYRRYDNLIINSKKYAQADKKIEEEVAQKMKKANVSVVDSYISINDSGEVILVKVIDVTVSCGDASTTQRELCIKPIK